MDIFRRGLLTRRQCRRWWTWVAGRLKNDTRISGSGAEKSSNSLRLNGFCIWRQLHGNVDLSAADGGGWSSRERRKLGSPSMGLRIIITVMMGISWMSLIRIPKLTTNWHVLEGHKECPHLKVSSSLFVVNLWVIFSDYNPKIVICNKL